MTKFFHIGDLAGKHRNQPCYVIGNGWGRKGVDLFELTKGSISIGCNALADEFSPTYLATMDGPAVAELWKRDTCPLLTPIIGNGERVHPAYLWKSISINSALSLGNEFDLRSTFVRGLAGVIALQTAILLECDPIILVGMEHCVDPETLSHSLYFNQGRHWYDYSGWIGKNATVLCGPDTVPLAWLDSVCRLWWISWRYGRERTILRLNSRGVLRFLPVVGDDPRPIEPPPTLNLEEFRRAFPELPFHQHAERHPPASPSASIP